MADIYKPHNIISPLALAEQNARVTILDCPNRHTGGARAHLAAQPKRSGTPCDISQERAALERIAKVFAQRTDEHDYDYEH